MESFSISLLVYEKIHSNSDVSVIVEGTILPLIRHARNESYNKFLVIILGVQLSLTVRLLLITSLHAMLKV